MGGSLIFYKEVNYTQMKKYLLILICLLFTSCYNTYHITTPEAYDEYINQVNQEIIDNGYQVSYIQEDTIYGSMRKTYHCEYGRFFYRNYVFVKPNGEVLNYTVEFQNGITYEEIPVYFVDTIHVTPNMVDSSMYNTVMKLQNPPKENAKAIKDGVVLGTIIGTPFALITSFLLYAAVANQR